MAPSLVSGLQILLGIVLLSGGGERCVSRISTIQGNLGQAGADNLAVSNVVGRHIVNALAVLGLSAVVLSLLLAVSMLVWGMASSALIGRDIPGMDAQGSYHTLAGFVLHSLERIAREADQLEWQGYRFEVVDGDGNRVDQLLMRLIASAYAM